jgi:hypothetical protein
MNEAQRKMCSIESDVAKSDRKERLALAILAACFVAISSGILAALIYFLLALSSILTARPPFAKGAPVGAGVWLQSGIEKESANGDLKAVMEIYEKIAAYKSVFSLAVHARAQATLVTIYEHWKTSSRPPGNDLPLVIVQIALSL